jgi:hypothetical protein
MEYINTIYPYKNYPCDVESCKECIWFYKDKQLKGNCKLYQFNNIDKNIKNCDKTE